MAKYVSIPGDGGVALVGLANPPTIDVACQVLAQVYDVGATFATSPPVPSLDGRTTYLGRTPTLTVTFLDDAGQTNSLADFLDTNEGTTIYWRGRAETSTPTYTYTCQAVPPGDLGTAGQPMIRTVTLPVLARVKT